MRILEAEREIIVQTVRSHDPDASIYLFGSRADDGKKGGDIDIIVFSKENPLHLSLRIQTKFFSRCEEKIDALVFNPVKLTEEQKAFLATIEMERFLTNDGYGTRRNKA